MFWLRFPALVALAFVTLAFGCIKDPAAERKATQVGECTFLCNAAGAWVFDDGSRQWTNDIWMKPEGVYARERGTDVVRFYKSIDTDIYENNDGSRLELTTNDDMMWVMPSGRAVRVDRLKEG